jgi:DNA-directed RNA polymerase subunit E'/Rpb7
MSSKKQSIYFKNILQKDLKINISDIGSNLTSIIKEILASTYEGKCLKEGYIKNNSIVVINYSSGLLDTNYVLFTVSFECLICRPIEGMKIKCKVDNVTKAGIRASYFNNIESPIMVFIARDHYYNNSTFTKIKEDDIIIIKVIGTRYELNDNFIYIIAELLKTQNKKNKNTKNTNKNKYK